MTSSSTESQTDSNPEPDKPETLWRHSDFLRLWSGQTLAMFGAEIARRVLPLIAVVLLHASATEMGVLSALSYLPFLLFLFAGVWVDRVRRRIAMIGTDLARFALVTMIPLLYMVGWLNMWVLYVVIFGMSVLGVMFETAYHAYLPTLVGREFIAEGNRNLELSRSTAQFAGPSLGGLAVSAVASAMVLVTSAVTYLASAVLLMFIRKPDTKPAAADERQNPFKAIGAGMSWVLRHPVLRTITTATAVFWFFFSALQALYLLYLHRELGVPEGWLVAIFAAAGPGAMIGSWLSIRVMKRIGLGPAVMWGVGSSTTILLLVPLASLIDQVWIIIGLVALSQFGHGLGSMVGTVIQTTLRQVLTPDEMQGRVVATLRALSLAMMPVGALLAGVLADAIGIGSVVWGASIGALLPIVVYATSVIPRMREMPSEQEAAEMAPKVRNNAQ